ncbi:MAG: prolipoprotein diacylglyceryl transferase, partial [Deltaproteobacteria bacterium]
MHPYIDLTLARHGLTLKSYNLFMLAAAVTVIVIGYRVAAHRGLPAKRTLAWLAVTALAMLPGARVMYLVTHSTVWMEHPELLWKLQMVYFSIYGGLILTVAVGGLACLLFRLPLRRLADSVVIGLALGIAVMRVGCYLNGCCFGKVTDLPWGVSFPTGSFAHNYQLAFGQKVPLFLGLPLAGSSAVHPTQLYELAAALLGTILAVYIMKRQERDGIAFLAFVIWFTGFRFLNHYLRAPSLYFTSPGLFYPLLYSFIIL